MDTIILIVLFFGCFLHPIAIPFFLFFFVLFVLRHGKPKPDKLKTGPITPDEKLPFV